MFVTIINDCHDDNVMSRQATRATSFFNCPVSTIGIGSFKDIEASGNIVDAIDASDLHEGIILVNSAPRHGRGKKWPNGTPFAYFTYKKILVVSTVDGFTLSLAKKLGLIDKLYLTDIPTVIDTMIVKNKFANSYRELVIESQFRSFDYVPRLAKWLMEGEEIPSIEYPIEQIEDTPMAVWWVDNFGNCKTTMLASDIDHKPGKEIQTKFGKIRCYDHLKDVPNQEAALVIGSSGLKHNRFIEFVVQGKSAAEIYHLTSGSTLF